MLFTKKLLVFELKSYIFPISVVLVTMVVLIVPALLPLTAASASVSNAAAVVNSIGMVSAARTTISRSSRIRRSGIVVFRILLLVLFVIVNIVLAMVMAGQQAMRYGTQLVGSSIRVWIPDCSKIVKRRITKTTGEDYRENVVDYAVQQ